MAHALASTYGLQGSVQIFGFFDDVLIDAVIQADEGEAFADFDERTFFVWDGIPGVILTNTVHVFCGAVAIQDDGAEGD